MITINTINKISDFIIEKLVGNDFEKYIDIIVSKDYLPKIIKTCLIMDIDIADIDIEMDYYGLYYVSIDRENFFIEALYRYNKEKGMSSMPLLCSPKIYYISDFEDDNMSEYLAVKSELKEQESELIPIKLNN